VSVSERGSATVLASAGVAVLVLVAAVGLWLAGAVQAAHLVRRVADVTALAGAQTARGGTASPCATAAGLAAANHARLLSCVADPRGDVTVTVQVRLGLVVPGLPSTAAGRARAGPAP